MQSMIRDTDWTRLRSWGNSRLIRTSFLWLFIVPIVARILEHVPDKLTTQINGTELMLRLELPFRWTVLYFASLFFAIAQIIYLVSCPRIIRVYKDFSEFQMRHRGGIALSRHLAAIVANRSKAETERIAMVLETARKVSLALYRQKFIKETPVPNVAVVHLNKEELWCEEATQSDIFDSLTAIVSRDRIIALWTSIMCFVLGFVLFLWLSVDSFLAVLDVMTR